MPDRSFKMRLSGRERLLLVRRTALYLRAGIPLFEALSLIQASHGSRHQARLLDEVIERVQCGTPFSQALASFSRVYSSSYIQLIAVGEASGTLSDALLGVATVLEGTMQRKRALLASLAYPFVLFVGTISISVFLLLYVFPKMLPLLKGLHASLPFATRALLFVSFSVQTHGVALVFCTLTICALLITSFRIRIVRERLDPFLLRLPIFGILFRTSVVAGMFRTVATLLASGIRIDESLRIAEVPLSNSSCRFAVARVRASILTGSKLSAALGAESFLFPPLALQLAEVGEMTGTLSTSLGSAAQILEEELAERLRYLSAALEPIIMIVMGLVIGFIALAIISPMYGITQNLSS